MGGVEDFAVGRCNANVKRCWINWAVVNLVVTSIIPQVDSMISRPSQYELYVEASYLASSEAEIVPRATIIMTIEVDMIDFMVLVL